MYLGKFCDTDVLLGRVVLQHPWSLGDFTFASNGHIFIRVPRDESIPENEQAPKRMGPKKRQINDYLADEPKAWYPIPELHPKEQDCEECGGSGRIDFAGINNRCQECSGKGKTPRHIGVEVGGIPFSDVYLSWIAELPGAEIGPMGPLEPARFRFKGGEGLLMPRTPK